MDLKYRKKYSKNFTCFLVSGLVLIVCGLILGGCSTLPRQGGSRAFAPGDYIEINSFCKKHNFQYSFDTLDDIIRLYSPLKEIKVLLNSSVGSFNGSVFYLKKQPIYSSGKLMIPRELDTFITGNKLVSFRPTFTIKTIVIDPGHGGKDPGAISKRGLREKTINLAVSRYLKSILEKQGFKVILTRSSDVYLTLKGRVDSAKKHNADLFISIHANSNRSPKVQGAEVYYLLPTRLKSSERALKLARSEDFYGKSFSTDVKAILWDLVISKNHSLSIEMSNAIFFAFKNLGFKVRTPRKAPFYVLRYAYVPSVLVEMGYLSNYYEEKALRKTHYQKQIAQAISVAVRSLQKSYNRFTSTQVNANFRRP